MSQDRSTKDDSPQQSLFELGAEGSAARDGGWVRGGLTAPLQTKANVGAALQRAQGQQHQEGEAARRRRDTQAAAARLHERLRLRLGRIDLTVTDNRRRMITVRRKRGRIELRLHHMFLGCDEAMVEAIVRFIEGDEVARARIQGFIGANRERIRSRLRLGGGGAGVRGPRPAGHAGSGAAGLPSTA